jgi:L-serine dehydratase
LRIIVIFYTQKIMVSLFQIFSIGVGPSSSHTVGPMRAARLFALKVEKDVGFENVKSIVVDLYGSLAMTGMGHGTNKAIFLGLEGQTPEAVDPNIIDARVSCIEKEKKLHILQSHWIDFDTEKDLQFLKGKRLPFHSNGICFKAFNEEKVVVMNQIYYSIGGGFIVPQEEALKPVTRRDEVMIPYPFSTCGELLEHCKKSNKKIYEIVLENERALRSEGEIQERILLIWETMQAAIERGFRQTGVLPGVLKVRRRAKNLYEQLNDPLHNKDPTEFIDWVSAVAISVNEENASGGRVVTAPTNGSAGVIPAVLYYYFHFTPSPSQGGLYRFFLTATAIAILYKSGASISAAEMGCQGEIGVSASMAAGGLTAALEGTDRQIENGAEIAMEHMLGLTCDPIAGLVQIPCIERNTAGAINAINASKLSLHGDGIHIVSLDQVIATMRQTGHDMQSTYKETSEAGLAVHVPVNVSEC